MTMLERKDAGQFDGKIGGAQPIDIKQLTEEGEFEGYASIFGELDGGGDVVMDGAFRESLSKRPVGKVKMLWQHRTDTIIGKWLDIREDGKGLYVKGRLNLNIDKARECRELMRDETLDGLSIGYRTIEHSYDRETDVRQLLKVDLREISLVTFPMLESAVVSLVKGDTMPTERELEKYLRDGGFSARQAKAIIADGYKSLLHERDAGTGDDEVSLEAIERLTRLIRA